MTPNKNWLTIRFDTADKDKIKFGNLELLRAERWVLQEDDGGNGGTKYDVQRDKRQVNPQTGTVVSVCENSRLNPGDKVFLHFLAYENAQWADEETALVREQNVLFVYEGDNIVPFNDNFFGEEVYTEPERTPSGIYVTTAETTKEATQILITHVPKKKSGIEIGDTVVTIDASQYTLTFNNKTYVKLVQHEIVGKVVNEGLMTLA